MFRVNDLKYSSIVAFVRVDGLGKVIIRSLLESKHPAIGPILPAKELGNATNWCLVECITDGDIQNSH